MKKLQKILSGILALAMVLSLAGCGASQPDPSNPGSDNPPPAEAPVEPSSPEAPAPEAPAEPAPAPEASAVEDAPDTLTMEPYDFPLSDDPAELSYFNSLTPGYASFIDDFSTNAAVQALEELTNVHIRYYSYLPENGQTQFGIMSAAGELPDIVRGAIDYYPGGMDKAVEEELLVDLGPHLDDCVNLAKLLDSDPYFKKSLSTDTGKIIGFPKYTEPSQRINVETGMMIRGDWLAQLGLEVPETYDQVHEVLTAFKNELNVKSPMIICSYLDGTAGSFASGYDVNAFFMTSPAILVPFYVVDGQVKCSILEDDFRDYLTMLRSYVEEGLADSDITAYTNEMTYQDKVLAGDTGFFWGFNVGNLPSLNTSIADGGYLVACPAIRKTQGQTLHFTNVSGDYQVRDVVNISANCRDLSLACRWLDCHYTQEVSMLSMFGVEGLSYEYGAGGEPQYTEMMLDVSDGRTLDINRAMYCLSAPDRISYDTYNTDKLSFDENQLEASQVLNSGSYDGEYIYPSGASMTTEESEEYTALLADISTYMAENIMTFITGERDMDEYPEFLETLDSMGVQDMIAYKQAAYDRYAAR